MKPLRSGRRGRLALGAVGTAAAMVLLPATASAQLGDDNSIIDQLVNVVTGQSDDSSGSGGGSNDSGSGGLPGVSDIGEMGDSAGDTADEADTGDTQGLMPEGGGLLPSFDLPVVASEEQQENVNDNEDGEPDVNEDLEVINQDNAEGYETDDPLFPDHAQGEVGDVNAGPEQQIDGGETSETEATIQDDGSSNAQANVFGLFGQEFITTEADSEGDTESEFNPAGAFCEASGGALCLNLFYSKATADADGSGETASTASAQSGIATLCLGGDNEDALSSSECNAPLELGVGEAGSLIARDEQGHTQGASQNDLVRLCLANSIENPVDFLQEEGGLDDCDGFSTKINHSESTSNSEEGTTNRDSFFIGFDEGTGEPIFRFDDPAKFTPAPLCADDQNDPGILCIFVNQGEAYVLEANPDNGTGSAQEADLVQVLPGILGISIHGGNAETVVRDCDAVDDGDTDCPGGGDGPDGDGPDGDGDNGDGDNGDGKPECSDGIDNDGDGLIDLDDPGCENAQDDSEEDGEGAPECSDGIDNDGDGLIDLKDPDCDSAQDDSEADGGDGVVDGDEGDELAFTGANIGPMLAAAFALVGLGALTMAATRRRVGKHVA